MLLKICLGILGANSPTSEVPSAQWTILIYLNGDNDLENFALDDLRELSAIGSSEEVNLIVQLDRRTVSGTQRFRVEKDPGLRVIEELPEQDLGDYRNLIDFADWGASNFPAQHYALVIWGHGSGWKKEELDSNIFKGISFDHSSGREISTLELGTAVRQISENLGRPLDLLALDACLMAMAEIADLFSDSADFMVASEEVIPGFGFPYDKIFATFGAQTDKSPRHLATTIVSEYAQSYSGGSQGTKHYSLSALDLKKFSPFKSILNAWVESIESGSGLTQEDLLLAAKESVAFTDPEFRDLGSYVSNIIAQANANLSTGSFYANSFALLDAIDEVVIKNLTSKKFARTRGLSIYLPYVWEDWSPWTSLNELDRKLRSEYHNLNFSKTTPWTRHLDQVFGTLN